MRRIFFAVIVICFACFAQAGEIKYAEPKLLAKLENQKITESSGVARGRSLEDIFWTHNDSGDDSILYAFNKSGEDLGTIRLDVESFDIEDMASFKNENGNWLLVADTGGNLAKRDFVTIYILKEPVPKKGEEIRVKPDITINFKFEDGKYDCEAVAVDAVEKKIILVTKSLASSARIYELPLPGEECEQMLVAKNIGSTKIFMATGMDISPKGNRCIIVTYANSYEFMKLEGDSWKDVFARRPRVLEMPVRNQGESICYGLDGKTLYLTSEKVPTPLWEIQPAEED